MGLDMYLVGHHYHTAYKDDVPRPMLDDKYHIESMNVDLGYWRKHADLHGYIVNTFADGVDECQRIELEADQLRKIANALRDNELPKNDDCHGFFFGGDEWWDELRSEGDEHAKLFDKAADWSESSSLNTVTYVASW